LLIFSIAGLTYRDTKLTGKNRSLLAVIKPDLLTKEKMVLFGNKAKAAALFVAVLIALYGTTEVYPIRKGQQGYWPRDRPKGKVTFGGSRDNPVPVGYYINPRERAASEYQSSLSAQTGGGFDN
jgi:hypothetical protein